MKKSKQILAFLFLLSSTISFGQNKKTEKSPELIARKQVDKMEVKYKLTKEQKESIYLLRVEEIETIRTQKSNPELENEEVKEMIKKHKEELKNILTDQQLEQIKNEKAIRKKEHHQKEIIEKEYKK